MLCPCQHTHHTLGSRNQKERKKSGKPTVGDKQIPHQKTEVHVSATQFFHIFRSNQSFLSLSLNFHQTYVWDFEAQLRRRRIRYLTPSLLFYLPSSFSSLFIPIANHLIETQVLKSVTCLLLLQRPALDKPDALPRKPALKRSPNKRRKEFNL